MFLFRKLRVHKPVGKEPRSNNVSPVLELVYRCGGTCQHPFTRLSAFAIASSRSAILGSTLRKSKRLPPRPAWAVCHGRWMLRSSRHVLGSGSRNGASDGAFLGKWGSSKDTGARKVPSVFGDAQERSQSRPRGGSLPRHGAPAPTTKATAMGQLRERMTCDLGRAGSVPSTRSVCVVSIRDVTAQAATGSGPSSICRPHHRLDCEVPSLES